MNQFPKDFDDECITCNHKACVALPSNRRGVGGRGNGGGGRGGVGGRGGGGGRCRCGSRGRGRGRGRSRSRSRGRGRGRICGGNYVQGNFSSPANSEMVRVVNGKAYAACKYCGWNSGNRAQTSGGHELSSMSGYSVTFALKNKMNKLLGSADGGSGGDITNDSGGGGGGVGVGGDGDVNVFAAKMMEICFIIEKEYSDPENAEFTGRFGGFLQSLIQFKKTMAVPYYWFTDRLACYKSIPPLPIIHPWILLRTSAM